MGGTVHDWVVDYEERKVEDIRMQRFVRVGCGIVTLATRRAFESALFEEEIVSASNINWDTLDWSKKRGDL